MNSFELLPNEIINLILFEYLDIWDIKTCLKTAKIFHVLTKNQLHLLECAYSGPLYCVRYNLLKELIWQIEMSLKFNIFINLHEDDEALFIQACNYGHIEIVEWLYEYSIKSNNPIKMNINQDIGFILSCQNNHIQVAKWLWEKMQKSQNYLVLYADTLLNNIYLSKNYVIGKWLHKTCRDFNIHVYLKY